MGGRTKGWAYRRAPAPNPHGLVPCSLGPARLFCALVTNARPTPRPGPSQPPGAPAQPLAAGPCRAGPGASDRPRVAGTPGPSPSRPHTHTPGPDPRQPGSPRRRRKRLMVTACLDRQRVRPESASLGGSSGEGRKGREACRGFRLHGGTFPVTPLGGAVPGVGGQAC